MLSLFHVFQKLARQLKGENMHRVILMLVVLILAGSAAFSYFEKNLGFWDALWWSVVTVTTVGYGDISPVTAGGRIIGILLMMLGIGFIGVLTATIAGLFIENKIKESKGMKTPDVDGQIVICGWNQRGVEIIDELRADHKTRDCPIVILADRPEKPADGVEIYFVSGEINRETLERAGLERAEAVIMLADESVEPGLRDAKTILDTLTVKNFYPDIFVCVELMQSKNIEHCKLAKADEIVVVGMLSSNLLVQAALDHGITGVISELVSNRTGNELYMMDLPGKYAGMTFLDVMIALKKDHGILCLGLEKAGGTLLMTNPDSGLTLDPHDRLVVISLDRPNIA